MPDNMGDRLKAYEARETKRNAFPYLPVYARIDGKGFSKFTKGMVRPFDPVLSEIMVETTKKLIQATHARIGYTQSDEISLVWLAEDRDEKLMFDGCYQKMTSILASMATAFFYPQAAIAWPKRVAKLPPMFDCRVFQLPTLEEGANAFLWREIDATKNAISMACRAYYSHKEMMHKNASEMNEMLFQRGINFNDYPPAFKRGSFLRRVVRTIPVEEKTLARIPEGFPVPEMVTRRSIERIDMPSFRKVTNRVDVIFNGADPILAGG